VWDLQLTPNPAGLEPSRVSTRLHLRPHAVPLSSTLERAGVKTKKSGNDCQRKQRAKMDVGVQLAPGYCEATIDDPLDGNTNVTTTDVVPSSLSSQDQAVVTTTTMTTKKKKGNNC
jgi:hypothetical protein